MGKSKTPVGVMSKKAWLENRARDLGGAIGHSTATIPFKEKDSSNIFDWTNELQDILREIGGCG